MGARLAVFSSHTESLPLHLDLELALCPQPGLAGASPGFPYLASPQALGPLHHVTSSEPGVPSGSPRPALGMDLPYNGC